MAESEFLCASVATILRNKYASILRVMSEDITCQNCQSFFLNFNIIDIAMGITLAEQAEELTQY